MHSTSLVSERQKQGGWKPGDRLNHGTVPASCWAVAWAATNLPQAFRGLISSGGLAHYLLRAQVYPPLVLM